MYKLEIKMNAEKCKMGKIQKKKNIKCKTCTNMSKIEKY